MKSGVVVLILVVSLGAFLRFYRQDVLGTFRGDQAIELSGARDILSGKLTLIGIKTSNSEVRNGAVMYYLLAPVLALTGNDPIAGGILQSLLSLGAIFVVWKMMAKSSQFSRLSVAFLIAASPLLVTYSRQTLLAFYPLFFFSLILWSGVKLARTYSRAVALVMGIILGFSMQIHYSTICLVLFCSMFPWFFLKREKVVPYYITVLGGFILGFAPMIAFELRHEFFNAKMFWQLVTSSTDATSPSSSLLPMTRFWVETVSRLMFGGREILAMSYLIVGGVLLVMLRRRMAILERVSLLLIGSTLVFTLIFIKDLRPPYEYISHYGLGSFIPLFILTAFVVERLFTKVKAKNILLPVLAILYLFINFPSYRLLDDHGYSSSSGWNLGQVKKAVDFISRDVGDHTYNVVMLVDGESRALPLRYFLDKLPNKPLGVENYSGATYLYVVSEPGMLLDNVRLWELSAFGPYQISFTQVLSRGYLLHRLTKEDRAGSLQRVSGTNKFVTLVYPVRSRLLWGDPNLSSLDSILALLEKNQAPSTWLLQYDALADSDLTSYLKEKCLGCEFGIFLEVSEQLATDARVSYKTGDGDWFRPDKVFFSGYQILERERLADLAFTQFHRAFGNYPRSVGGWYVDPYTLGYIQKNYGVSGLVAVADQLDTDAQRYWGKPWGVPFYHQKYDAMTPANTKGNKLDLIEIQWAQRHPTLGYGPLVSHSRESLQANDYVNNGKDTRFFEEVLAYYLSSVNPFSQVTIGLEVGQELYSFATEHERQLAHLWELESVGGVKLVTVSEFADWYRQSYPDFSPPMTISDGTTTWINTPCYRAGTREGKLIDSRVYFPTGVSPDYTSRDDSQFLQRDASSPGPVIDPLTANCLGRKENLGPSASELDFLRIKEGLNEALSFLKYARRDGEYIIGLDLGDNRIFGYWQGRGVGNFFIPFQSLVKFQSLPSAVIE